MTTSAGVGAPLGGGLLGEVPAGREVDVLVVGSGPGGAVTAAELARGGRDVLVLEEGPPPGATPPEAFGRREMEERYRAGGITPALGPTPVTYVEGRCVGGGSEVNSGLYHRTPAGVLEAWRRDLGVVALEDAELEPHFRAVEEALGVAPHPEGGGPASRRLRDGAAALGWSVVEVPRWVVVGGVPGGSRTETRRSMTRSYLAAAVDAGARILPWCRGLRLRRTGSAWEVEARFAPPARPAGAVSLRAPTVVVAGGAVQTPFLLRRSGIRRRVGDTLALHPTVKAVARFGEPVHGGGEWVGVHQVREFAPDFSLGCSVSTAPHQALALLDHPAALREVAAHAGRTAVYYAMTAAGRGSVRALPGFDEPLVRYRVGQEGLERLGRGLRALAECLLAAGAEVVFPSVAGAPAVRTRADLDRLPRTLPAAGANLMTVHLMASCPMGEDRRRCTVDSFGRIHGHDGLLVADASMLGGPVGVNPQGTIMALARRNALRLLGEG